MKPGGLADRGRMLLRTRGWAVGITGWAALAIARAGLAAGGGGGGSAATGAGVGVGADVGAAGAGSGGEGLGALLLCISALHAAFLTSGVVSRDRSVGTFLLWVQRPGDPALLYLRRWGERLCWTVLVTAGLGVATALLAASFGSGPVLPVLREILPPAAAVALLVSSWTFAFSAAGSESDGALGILFPVLILVVDTLVRIRSGVPLWLAVPTETLARPLHAIPALGGARGAGSRWLDAATPVILAVVGAVALALLLVEAASRPRRGGSRDRPGE